MTKEGAESRAFLATLLMLGGLVLSYGTALTYGLRYLSGR